MLQGPRLFEKLYDSFLTIQSESIMTEMEFKIALKSIIGIILVCIGVVIILYGVFQAYIHASQLEALWEGGPGTSDIQMQKWVESFYWFFTMVIELLAGFFLASIGTKIAKK